MGDLNFFPDPRTTSPPELHPSPLAQKKDLSSTFMFGKYKDPDMALRVWEDYFEDPNARVPLEAHRAYKRCRDSASLDVALARVFGYNLPNNPFHFGSAPRGSPMSAEEDTFSGKLSYLELHHEDNGEPLPIED